MENLLPILRVHNPWLVAPQRQSELLRSTLPRPYVPRTPTLDLRPGLVELVVGPRQAGKSTWIRHELARLDDPVLVLHAEEPLIRELCASPGTALHGLEGLLTEGTVLFFEEVQHLADAPLFLKGIVDLQPRRRVVATGSASLQLRSGTRESLAGRARRTVLLPLSLAEVSATLPEGLAPAVREAEMEALWDRMVVWGGYPGPWFDPDPEAALHRLVEAFALRDASDFQGVEVPAAFRRLLELAAADAGQLVNQSTWASVAQVSRATVARYLDVAQDAHLISLVAPFAGGRRAEVTGTPKAYYLDNGLRNAVFGGFAPAASRPDRGALVENAVYAELRKRCGLLDDIRFWRTKNKAEVDFVVRRGDRLVAVEAKAGARPLLSRAARSFVEAYRPRCLAVVSRARPAEEGLGDTRILFRRPWELGDVLAHLEDRS